MSLVWSPERKYEHENDLSLVAPGAGIVKAVGKDRNGATLYTLELTRFTPGSAVSVQSEVPWTKQYELLQNYPNPFNPSTTIRYTLSIPGYARLAVYNLLGAQVALLSDGLQSVGTHTAVFNAAGLTSGFYYYRLTTAEGVRIGKMNLVK